MSRARNVSRAVLVVGLALCAFVLLAPGARAGTVEIKACVANGDRILSSHGFLGARSRGMGQVGRRHGVLRVRGDAGRSGRMPSTAAPGR